MEEQPAHSRVHARHNLEETPSELQAYFNRRVQEIVAKHGKRMEGWDEILDPDLPKDIVIQSWRGQKVAGRSRADRATRAFFRPATIWITWSRLPQCMRWTRWKATPPR